MNRIEALHMGLEILFRYRELIDFTDTDFWVVPKCADLSSAPEHSRSGYIAVATTAEIPNHSILLAIAGWSYEYPYYTFYMI